MFPDKVTDFVVTVDLVADLVVINPFDFFVEEDARELPFTYAPELKTDLEPYLRVDAPGPQLQAYLDGVQMDGCATVDFLVELNRRLQPIPDTITI